MVRTKRVLGIALALSLVWAVPAMAGQPDNPPADAGRNVIADAEGICGADPAPTDFLLAEACSIFAATDNLVITGPKADRNKAALQRNAASAVLSLDDVVTREKVEQKATAASYLCSYADKIGQLIAAGNIVDPSEGNLELATDLAARATTLAGNLGFGCLDG